MEKETVNKRDAHKELMQKNINAQAMESVVCENPDDECSIRRKLLEYALLELHRKRKACIERERNSRLYKIERELI